MKNLEGLNQSPLPGEQNSPTYQIKDFNEIVGKSASEIQQLVERYNYKILWTYAANCILGLWLLTNPHLFDYKSSALTISDTASGALIILLEALSFTPRLARLRWGTAIVGFWLLFAPLIFWSPTPAVFLVDTLIACLLITFSILIPGSPGSG